MTQKEKQPSEIISDFIELMKTAQEQYKNNKSKCEELDSFDRTVYWKHSFEFATNKAERNKLGTALQRERQERRGYKDVVDLYKTINDFAHCENNKPTLKRLNTLLSMQSKQEEYLSSDRHYKGEGGDLSGTDNN